MGVTPLFHDALILSIVEMVKGNEEYSIFDFIQLMIRETNWVLSPGARDLGFGPLSEFVQMYVDGKYSYPLISQHYGSSKEKKKILYRDCLVKIHKILNEEWDVTWYEFLTYLLFIQSNCHHKGGNKLCRNSNSFLNFFYKSKSAFNPWSQWEKSGLKYSPVMDYIQETKTEEFRGEWWVNAFEREKKVILMFHTLAPTHYLGTRFTTGWIDRGLKPNEGDILPQGSVLNQLREYYELPSLSGDYGLGCISEKNKVQDEPVLKDKALDFPSQGEMCVYFNLGFCIACGIVCMKRLNKGD
tara:strand:+ start:209 stop:1105 length:897 start_codon:yes stop_codon:yes gene_type:complete